MKPIQKHLVALLLMVVGSAGADLPASGTPALKERSLPELQQRLAAIDAELEQLASFTVRGGTGSTGYRSKIYLQPDNTEWIRIELGEEVAVDEVVLVPSLYRDANTGLRSEGFPIAFRVLAGTDHATNVVAAFSAADHLLPRIAPLAVPFQPVNASWVEIEATTLSSAYGHDYALQFSEIMVFSGMDNVALRKPVRVESSTKGRARPLRMQFLTDGFTPFLMNAARGSSSHSGQITVRSQNLPPTLTIDLNTSQPVQQINLHTADLISSVPMRDFS